MKNDSWNNLNTLVRLRLGAIALAAVLVVGAFYTGLLNVQNSGPVERATGLNPSPDSLVSSSSAASAQSDSNNEGIGDAEPTPAEGLVYNGTAQTLINDSGNTQYDYAVKPLEANDEWKPTADGWKPEIPQGTAAGSYCIYYKLSDSEESEPKSVTVTIGKKELAAHYDPSNPDNPIVFVGLIPEEDLTLPEDYTYETYDSDDGIKMAKVILTNSAKAQNYSLNETEIIAGGGAE